MWGKEETMRQAVFSAVLFCGMLMFLMARTAVRKDIVFAQAAPAVEAVPAVAQAQDPARTAPLPDSACQISHAYPEAVRRWCGTIQASAMPHNLDPNLVAAVMLQESGGNPDAYSRSGAVGLMQIMPRDGIAAQFQCQGGPCFRNRPAMAELYDPAFNIQFGAEMITGLIYRHGSLREALRAYGPMDVGYRYADLVLAIYENYHD